MVDKKEKHMKLPKIIDMLKAGMHFGHRSSNWHPKMAKYIFETRQGSHIIDLRQTQEILEAKAQHITDLVSKGGVVLFVGTKNQAKALVKEQAERCGMPYIDERWIGGLLTNYNVVIKLARKLTDLKKKRETGELEKYTKKEQLQFKKEIERLEKLVGGIESLSNIPEALFVVDVKNEKTAIAEATQKGVEVIAICDTNVNPDAITHIIPANDDAVKSIEMILTVVADAVLEGKKKQETKS